MYFVIVSSIIGNSIVESYEYKEEAKDRVKEWIGRGQRTVRMAEEIPMKIKVKVEIQTKNSQINNLTVKELEFRGLT